MKRLILFSAMIVVLASARPAPSQETLPESNGKKTVQDYCVQCHELSTVTRGAYSVEGWRNNLRMMMNVGAAVPKDEIEPLVQYLAKNFPERRRPDAVIVPGSAKITIKEWLVPTPGSRPHDPLATADGAIWYTGQFANTLGRLDPKTGKIKEFHLPAKSGPHGLTADKEGNIWYTGNFKSTVGKLNPRTGEVTEYYMPNPAARDPHTPIFDKSGTLWFTVQGGNMVGRLNPQTDDLRLLASPTRNHDLMGWSLTRRIFLSLSSSGAISSPVSIRTQWRFGNTSYQIRNHGRGVSPSRATMSSGIRIIHEGIWAGMI